jgi:mannose-1-phosphate guanylyltransferase
MWLRPLTDWLAKPMVPIGDAPAVEHVARRLRAAGIERFVVNVHHRPADLRAWAASAGAAISEEAALLGTAGGVARARALLGDGDVLVWNGDILSELDPADLTRTHERSGALATLAIVRRACGEGNVGLDADGRVVRLRKEVFGEETSGADFIGVHVVGAKLRPRLPERGCLVGDLYIPALGGGARLATHVVTSRAPRRGIFSGTSRIPPADAR